MELRPELLQVHGTIEHKLKDDKTVVTTMDVMVETRLRDSLAELEPAIGFVGEESGGDMKQSSFWLVDPIDGTEPFIRGLPFSTNMIALIHNGEPVMGVIYNFILDEYFHAIKGGGATKNGHAIHVSDRPLRRAFIGFGPKLKNPKHHGIRDRLRLKIVSMPQVGAGGYVLAAIASGAIEGMITFQSPGGPWDYAPGALLVTEAGGRVANFGSTSYDFTDTQLIASNAVIFDELKASLEDEIAAAERAPEHEAKS
jgi:myo-inositol-1(or 4)-monophosphatase